MTAEKHKRRTGELGAGPWVGLGFVLAAFLLTAAAYSSLPQTIARHWDAAGAADGFSGKGGAFSIPLVMLGLWLILTWLPGIFPLRANFDVFRPEYEWFVAVLEAFLFGVHVWTLAWNLGWQVGPNNVLPIGLGVLLGYVAWVMGRVPRNWVIGVRTAWTLSDDRVWVETHRAARWMWAAAAAVCALGVLFPQYAMWFVLVPVLLATVGSIAYSYVVWVRLGRPEAPMTTDS